MSYFETRTRGKGKDLQDTGQSMARNRRFTVKPAANSAARASHGVIHTRRRCGIIGVAKTSLRRMSTGTNHISAFGVWQGRARRTMPRINRTGETRWHRLPTRTGNHFGMKGILI
ncbi:MAG: hypothetical protein JF627_08030 [Alphaproteobacteria bacterium]|nr:hypothetical protein [Alphaproteobacteria bacterium]